MSAHKNLQLHEAGESALQESLSAFHKLYMAADKQEKSVHEIIQAITEKRIIYLAEPWINSESNTVANELLFRYRYAPGQICSFGDICKTIINADLTAEFDLVNVFNILSWMPNDQNNVTASINIGHDLLTKPYLMDKILNVVSTRSGPSIIFEILEDDRQFTNDEIEYLKTLKDKGMTFALDDLRINYPSDWQRLESLKDIVSYVKLDGEASIRPYINQDSDGLLEIEENIREIKTLCGADCKIIAEWVQTPEEAEKLFEIGAHAIQGHDIIMHQNTSQKTNTQQNQKRFK
ncbi:MAG: EAL domain-containing protein [Alphaproteobacteria bacterium]|nr:EAL domain-containing protein [Alphaproteobacteria bacterium]